MTAIAPSGAETPDHHPASRLYLLRIQVGFCSASAHAPRGYSSGCRRLHDHSWKAELEVAAKCLDGVGMAPHFNLIKAEARALAAPLDHRYLNEIGPFDHINPTAGNLARWFYRQLAVRLRREGVWLQAVTLWETDSACVHHSEAAP